jgi:dihydroflavonol-4-reductase
MTQIDKSKPVMITGATGYVAGWIVKKLLDEGFTVHAPVREPENAKKLQYLDKIAENAPGTIIFYKADLLDEGSYAEAMAGCQIVLHTASPFKIDVVDPQKELVDPAQLGTRNINRPWKGDNSKSVRELDMRYRSLNESMIDFFQQMIDSGLLQPAK